MHPASSTSARMTRAVLAMLLVAAGLVTAAASPAAAGDHTMTFDGRGYGHGRGMSQYGAQGYAANYGKDSGWILDHYYGGTHAGAASSAASKPVDPEYVRIRLQRMSGKQIRVTIDGGFLTLAGGGSVSLPGNAKTVLLNPVSSSGNVVYDVWYGTTASCSAGLTPLGVSGSSAITVGKTVADADSTANLIRVCESNSHWYPGSIQGQIISGTSQATNITKTEKQLRSVVPNESPSSWKPAALEAQAVAARSYALAGDNRWPGADTCDTTYCQVYDGWFSGSGTKETATSTDAAVSATAGQVRLTSSNTIARTEFHSTSGGWTAGGTFPAVEDLGDSISPLHTWRRTVSVAPLESAYGKGGSLLSIEVTKRNGLGADGGRVVTALLHFSNGLDVSVSGNTIRSKLGLLSDWFTPACGEEIRYLNAVFQLFVQRDPGANEINDWCGLVRSGDQRQRLTNALSLSDEWAGLQIRALYDKILGRPADADGYAYWLGRVRSGYRIEDIASYFYGGSEYFQRSGSTNGGFVDHLYRDLLGRPADSDGRAYWVDRLDRGVVSRSGAAANFYASIESRKSRVQALYRKILGRSADASGLDYWANQLLTLGDVKLAAFLGASQEYFDQKTS